MVWTMNTFKELLWTLDACVEARCWVGDRTLEEAWVACDRADWMFWFLESIKLVDNKLAVFAACQCVRMVLRLVEPHEDRPRAAIEIAEAWTRGEATRVQVEIAKFNVWDIRRSSHDDVCYDVIDSVCCACEYNARGAVHWAARALEKSTADNALAFHDALSDMAHIVRKHVPFEAVKLAVSLL